MMAWLHCWLRSHHNPIRHPLGAFRCADCGAMGLSLQEMGFRELGRVAQPRKRFLRDETVSRIR